MIGDEDFDVLRRRGAVLPPQMETVDALAGKHRKKTA
jgi:hypothetical protein